MSILSKASLHLLLCLFGVLFIGCETDSNSDCNVKAFYEGTNVCNDNGNSAAIKIESNDKFLILDNFFDFIDMDAMQYGAVVYVSYEDVDFDEISPALCGPLIVAPVTSLTCLTLQ